MGKIDFKCSTSPPTAATWRRPCRVVMQCNTIRRSMLDTAWPRIVITCRIMLAQKDETKCGQLNVDSFPRSGGPAGNMEIAQFCTGKGQHCTRLSLPRVSRSLNRYNFIECDSDSGQNYRLRPTPTQSVVIGLFARFRSIFVLYLRKHSFRMKYKSVVLHHKKLKQQD